MKFLIDMPLSPQLAVWLKDQGHSAVHAVDVGLDRAADIEIMACAREERRVVVTADLDYPRLLAQADEEGPGLILFRGGNYSEREAIERLDRALQVVPAEELWSSIVESGLQTPSSILA